MGLASLRELRRANWDLGLGCSKWHPTPHTVVPQHRTWSDHHQCFWHLPCTRSLVTEWHLPFNLTWTQQGHDIIILYFVVVEVQFGQRACCGHTARTWHTWEANAVQRSPVPTYGQHYPISSSQKWLPDESWNVLYRPEYGLWGPGSENVLRGWTQPMSNTEKFWTGEFSKTLFPTRFWSETLHISSPSNFPWRPDPI